MGGVVWGFREGRCDLRVGVVSSQYNCEDTTFSSIFDKKGRFEIGL